MKRALKKRRALGESTGGSESRSRKLSGRRQLGIKRIVKYVVE